MSIRFKGDLSDLGKPADVKDVFGAEMCLLKKGIYTRTIISTTEAIVGAIDRTVMLNLFSLDDQLEDEMKDNMKAAILKRSVPSIPLFDEFDEKR